VTEGDSLEAVVKLMEHRHVKRLPVLRDDRVVGIVSRADVMDAFIERAHYQAGPADDATVRERILAALAHVPWAPHVEVKVHDGIAELSAVITDERERNAVIVAVENVGGVKAVHDHMVWVEPMSGVAIPSAEDEAADRAGEPAERAPH
jgi:CBS domain-containing protein